MCFIYTLIPNLVIPKTLAVATTKKMIASANGKSVSVPHTESLTTKKKTVRSKSSKKKDATESKEQKSTVTKRKSTTTGKKVTFHLKFHTTFGQDLFIVGNHPLLGNNDPAKAIPLQYFNEEYWVVSFDFTASDLIQDAITYHYILRNTDGTYSDDWGNDKQLNFKEIKAREIHVSDAWNFAGYYENAFYTEPFTQVLLRSNQAPVSTKAPKTTTHILKVKAPLLKKGQTLCLLGSSEHLGNWDTQQPHLLSKNIDEDFFQIALNLSKDSFPIAYKYGVYDVEQQQFLRYEDGNNRVLYDAVVKDKVSIIHDGFAVLPNNTWKGAGVAIPVFSLRTEHGLLS